MRQPQPSPGERLRAAVEAERPLQIVGTINAYAALLAERAGFRAIYLSGGGVANASFGLPDLGVTTLNERYHSPLGLPRMLAEYALFRHGPLTMAPSQLGLFTRSNSDQARANLQYHIQPLSLDRFGEPLHKFPAFTASVCNLRPTSRGTVRLRSREAADPPVIRPNYLATEDDRRIAASSIRLTRRIVSQPALAPFHPDEYLPGPAVRGDDEQGLIKAAGDIGTTIFHPVGTAKMGLPSDPTMVVDDRLRVAGVERLRVIDASVMPTITSGNTNAPTMMIAEKAAEMILADARAAG